MLCITAILNGYFNTLLLIVL